MADKDFSGAFAGLRSTPEPYAQGRRYVSFHLTPVYGSPDLLDDFSPEMTDLTRRGHEAFAANGLLEVSDG